MNELSIAKSYPASKYNLLGNTGISAVVEIPEIKKPVIQAVKLDPNPDNGDVYKLKGDFAITKNGLKKLADGAGIKMVSSEHVLPSTCYKCAMANRGASRHCGSCPNNDIAFKVTISVPQLTGEALLVEDTHEINVEDVTANMSAAQKAEFLKFMPQICEAKALNGAIRTALHIKGKYTKDELSKPFVVAYLIPNLDHEEVKRAAIADMFSNTRSLFGPSAAPSVECIENAVPDHDPAAAIEAADGADIDKYVDDTYDVVDEPQMQVEEHEGDRPEDFYCDQCGNVIERKVWDYSVDKFGRPLCYKCQQAERRKQGGGARR